MDILHTLLQIKGKLEVSQGKLARSNSLPFRVNYNMF